MDRTDGFVLVGLGAAGVLGVALLAMSKRHNLHGATLRGAYREADSAVSGTIPRLVPGRSLTPGKKPKLVQHVQKSMSIDERVAILRDVGHESIKDPAIRKLALQITRGCRSRDGVCEARAIYDWIHKNIRYTGDIGPHHHGRNGPYEGIDVFMTAARTVEFGGEDCDGHAVLACALGIENGFTCRYRITAPTNTPGADDWSHIYAMLGMPKNDPKKWIPIDTTLPNGNMFNREYPYGKKQDYDA